MDAYPEGLQVQRYLAALAQLFPIVHGKRDSIETILCLFNLAVCDCPCLSYVSYQSMAS